MRTMRRRRRIVRTVRTVRTLTSQWVENLTKDQKAGLIDRGADLKELSPACDCLGPDLLENGQVSPPGRPGSEDHEEVE